MNCRAVIVRKKKQHAFKNLGMHATAFWCSAIPILNDFPKSEAISVSIIRGQCNEERTVHNDD